LPKMKDKVIIGNTNGSKVVLQNIYAWAFTENFKMTLKLTI